MSHNLLLNSSFHQQLRLIDQEYAEALCAQGCPFCSGPLHKAHYPRTGFGIPRSFRSFYDTRYSFCCGHCRRRSTPASVRFLGVRRFVAFVVILICAQRSGAREKRIEKLASRFNISLSVTTWKRWRQWWREQFPVSEFWRQTKGLFNGQYDLTEFPGPLLKRLSGASLAERLIRLLCLLRPLTGRVI